MLHQDHIDKLMILFILLTFLLDSVEILHGEIRCFTPEGMIMIVFSLRYKPWQRIHDSSQ